MAVKGWFTIVVPAHRELLAVKLLTEAGIMAFAPVQYVHVRRGRTVAGKQAPTIVRPFPLMPRYVFICDPDWYMIRAMEFPGTMRRVVNGVLSANGVPYRLPNSEIMHLHHLAEHGPPTTIEAARELHPGDICIINGGPFDGRRVKVTRTHSKRIWCEFAEVARSLSEIEIPVSMLEAA